MYYFNMKQNKIIIMVQNIIVLIFFQLDINLLFH